MIVKVVEKEDNKILLFLRGNKFEGEFMSLLLLPHRLRLTFREVKRYNVAKKRRRCQINIKVLWMHDL